ncbi:augmin complex subunit dgt4 [Drosophila ficusphila]|uniref:augmin complex subunit dgt4 n=1 Tax=Drosophila ficusphila TaxID=30025 RepID=UPI0007E88F8D|nr:augmin complex subunit dgt4 [Drosophila ficusphila]
METPPTPTLSTPPAALVEGEMDDIQYLLHLEAMRRFQEDNRHIKRQVEEQARLWLDAKCEYNREFARLTRLLKCAALQKAVDGQRVNSDVDHVARAENDIESLRSKLSRYLPPASVASKEMELCLEQLKTAHKPRLDLSRQQREFAQNQEALKGLRTAVDALENGLEIGIMQGMDHLIEDLLPPGEKSN